MIISEYKRRKRIQRLKKIGSFIVSILLTLVFINLLAIMLVIFGVMLGAISPTDNSDLSNFVRGVVQLLITK